MAVHAPGARLAAAHRGRSSKKKVDATIALIPFVDFLLTVVVFLLMTFSASEIPLAADLPSADHGAALTTAPVVSVDSEVVTMDGMRVASTPDLMQSAELDRVDDLVRALDTARLNWETVHPNEAFEGRVVLQIDRAVDFRVVRKVMFSASQAGYGDVDLAVRER
jgi:biopolymer transport protein ExbD